MRAELPKTYLYKEKINEHISLLSPSVRQVYKTLRSMARQNMPGAHEMWYHNAIGYSLTESPWDRISYIAAQPKGYVNFGFFFGVGLPDPSGLIQGEGKRIRHVKIYTIEQAKDPALVKLVEAAWEKADRDIKAWRQSLKKK